MTFGKALKAWMAETGKNAQTVADEAGISSAAVYHYLNEDTTPQRAKIALICEAFGCNMKRFLRGPAAEEQDATLFGIVGLRICGICRADKDTTCKLCRLHQCARALQMVEAGMDIKTAVEQSEEEATRGLKSINGKYDQTHDIRGL